MAPTVAAELRRRQARIAARRRLEELRREEATIRAAFPELFVSNDADITVRPVSSRRPQPTMSAARRQAVSERMKTYWAARRRTQNG
jgi:hypothetical protein